MGSEIAQSEHARVAAHLSCEGSDGFAPPHEDIGAATAVARRGVRALGVAIIERQRFLRDCLSRSVESDFGLPVQAFETLEELESRIDVAPVSLVLLSWIAGEFAAEEKLDQLARLRRLLPQASILVLVGKQNPNTARLAIANGARGYIPMSVGLEIAFEAARFVLAGGTYAPPEVLFGSPEAGSPAPENGAMTAREALVIRKIQEGKPNKVIAFELNMCESTVKIHVRQVMKKLGARNRTDLAIKAHNLPRI